MIAYEVAVWCDADDCEGSLVWDIVHVLTGATINARHHAARNGWKRRRTADGYVDLCPEHSTYAAGGASPEGADHGR